MRFSIFETRQEKFDFSLHSQQASQLFKVHESMKIGSIEGTNVDKVEGTKINVECIDVSNFPKIRTTDATNSRGPFNAKSDIEFFNKFSLEKLEKCLILHEESGSA